MWYVYIIYSKKIDRYYVGVTEGDLRWRIERHNMGWGRYTKRSLKHKISDVVLINNFGKESMS